MPSPTRHVPRFPPEIIDEILRDKALALSDLASFCLVSKAWLEPARKSLYQDLDIYPVPCLFPLEDGTLPEEVEEEEQRRSYYLGEGTSELLSTILLNRRLALHVRSITFRVMDPDAVPSSDRTVIWMRPSDALSTFARLCPSIVSWGFEESGRFSKDCSAAIRFNSNQIQRLSLPETSRADWKQLKHLPRLQALALGQVTQLSSSTSLAVLEAPLVDLEIRDCTLADFDAIRKAIRLPSQHSLRSLCVPLHVMAKGRLSSFTRLRSLTILGSISAGRCDIYGFLTDLERAASLKLLCIDPAAQRQLLDGTERLGCYLPAGCCRVNLGWTSSLDTIRSVIETSSTAGGVSEVGITEGVRKSKNEKNSLFFAGVRAMLDTAKVELVWY